MMHEKKACLSYSQISKTSCDQSGQLKIEKRNTLGDTQNCDSGRELRCDG
jgi:hypothetical protein